MITLTRNEQLPVAASTSTRIERMVDELQAIRTTLARAGINVTETNAAIDALGRAAGALDRAARERFVALRNGEVA